MSPAAGGRRAHRPLRDGGGLNVHVMSVIVLAGVFGLLLSLMLWAR